MRVAFVGLDIQTLVLGQAVQIVSLTRITPPVTQRFFANMSKRRIAEVVRRSVHWVVRASASAIDVDIDLPGPLPVRGSAGQMQQVVVNLVQNAVDATEGRAGGALEIRGRADASSVELAFRDNGSGFSAEGLARAFEPFFTTKPPGKGTGLGLSISYGLAQRHGGSLAAANDARGGAVMTLTLPRAAGGDARSAGGAAAGEL